KEDIQDINDFGFTNVVSDLGLIRDYSEAKKLTLRNDIYGSWLKISGNHIEIRTDHLAAQKVYYFFGADVTIISSNLKLIFKVLNILDVKYHLNNEQAILYLYSREPKWPETIIREINCLLPGTISVIKNKTLTTKHYDININNNVLPYNSLRQYFTSLDSQSTISTLSGGVDSQCVSNICAKMGINKAISCAFSSELEKNDYNSFDELPYARKFSAKVGIDLSEKKFTVKEVKAIRIKLLKDIEQPAHDSTSFYLLC
ncbi:asparagine synthase-related protein, partial [Photobacterium sanguinicancri]